MATNENRIQVLLVEDSPSDAQLLCELLQDYPQQMFAMERAERLEEAIRLVAERTFDVVLLDLTLPDSAGLDTCTRMRRAAPHVPIVVLTGVDDETMALEAMRQGVEDYLVKGQIFHGGTVGRTVRYAVERSRSELALRESEERYHTLFSTMSEGFALHEILCDGDGRPCDYRFLDVNLAFERQTGLKAADLVGRTVREVLPGIEPIWIERYGRVALTGRPEQFEACSSSLGRWYDVRAYQTVPGRFAAVFTGITERRQVEAVQSFLAQSAGASGHEDFFQSLARYLGQTLGADFVCIDRLVEDGLSAQTVAVYYDGKFEDNLAYTLKDTPCGNVVGRTVCCFPRDVRGLFPRDAVLQEMKAEGYVGTTLWGHQGEPIGLIALIWRRPLEDPSSAKSLLQLVAARTAGELERKQAEAALRESEDRLKRSEAIAHLGSWELDLVHNRLTWSDEVYRIFGLDPQAFGATYETFLARVHPDDRAAVDAAYSTSVRENRDTYEIEHRVVRHSNGETRIVHEKGEHFRDASGRIVRSVGMVHDITERKTREARETLITRVLEAINRAGDSAGLVAEILRLVKESSGLEAVGIRLRQGEDYPYYVTGGFAPGFVEAERHLSARDQTGEIVRDAAGHPVLECMCGNVIGGRFDPSKPFFTKRGSFWTNGSTQLLASTTEQDRQSRTRNRCNGEGYESVALIPLRAADEVIGLLQLNDRRPGVFTREMIEFFEGLGASIGIALARQRAEEALRELNATLESKVAQRTSELEYRARQLQKLALELSQAEDRERRRLAEILHDDLQQQLAAAKFHLSLLNGRVKSNVATRDAIAQVDQILTDTIERSRSLSHELSPAVLFQSDLSETLEWLARQFKAKHGLTVDVESRGRIDSPSEALKIFLYKTAQEILFNVVKHAKVNVARLRLQRMRGCLWLTISDQGQGFDPQLLGKTGGLGLLSIRERIELLGGRMKIRSAEGRGSTLLIVVPDGQKAEEEGSKARTYEGAASAPSSLPPFSPSHVQAGHRLRVLLVDDHKIVREGLAALLKEQPDVDVVGEAGNGREAVDLAHELQPDVVVMDVSMPVMAGDEATRQIKLHLPGVRIVALSMFEEAGMAESMRKAGAEAYLLKTAPSDELLAAIRGRS